MSNEAGKGDAPRKGADQEKYAENWEKIFGKKKQTDDTDKAIKLNDKEFTNIKIANKE